MHETQKKTEIKGLRDPKDKTTQSIKSWVGEDQYEVLLENR